MRTYVLVHGAFSGGWMWKDMARRLRAADHEVYTPTLTGLGERVHLGTPATDLSTHVQDVVNVIEYEELHDIVLAGFSYGGMVITGVADRMPERIAHLVYVDAELPRDGESEADATGEEEWAKWDAWFERRDGRVFLRLPPDLPPEEGPRSHRLVGQPERSFEEKIRLSRPVEGHPFGLTFVAASDTAAPLSIARVHGNPGRWRFFQVPSSHSVHRDAPDDLAKILLDLA